jgi:hypothetical protein
LIRAQAEQTPGVVGIDLALQQMILVALADFSQRTSERLSVSIFRKACAATMRAKTDVVVKLISPVQNGKRGDLHAAESKTNVRKKQAAAGRT